MVNQPGYSRRVENVALKVRPDSPSGVYDFVRRPRESHPFKHLRHRLPGREGDMQTSERAKGLLHGDARAPVRTVAPWALLVGVLPSCSMPS